MIMDIPEIVRSYNEAKYKASQIGVLADLNGCSREQIEVILKGQGITDIPKLQKRGRPVNSCNKPKAEIKKPVTEETIDEETIDEEYTAEEPLPVSEETESVPEPTAPATDPDLEALFTEGLKALDNRIAYYERKLAKARAQKEKLLQIKEMED